jgi:hypothetical protein
MGWFPVFEECIRAENFINLTPTEKLLFWYLGSEFNRRGDFYQSDLEIAKTLATSEKTIRRGRKELTAMGLIEAKPGTITRRKQFLATRYVWVRYANVEPEEDRHFAQVPRFTFQVLLELLRKANLRPGDVVVYICLSYWYWRNHGKSENRDRFFITKKALQKLTNLRNSPTRVRGLYEAFVFSGGKHLFEYQEEHHRITFTDWCTCAEPEQNEQSQRIAESYVREIKDLVTQEKRERQLKVQQKIAKTSLPPFEFFRESYKNKYGRFPKCNFVTRERFDEIEITSDYIAICHAINWYLSNDKKPNCSGAKVKTMGKFIANIKTILRSSKKNTLV